MSQKVLVINCGSSSLKYAIIDAHTGGEVVSGQADMLNCADARVSIKYNGEKTVVAVANADHRQALLEIIKLINTAKRRGVDCRIVAVGHRVVHGGEMFKQSVLITADVIAGIKRCCTLAPLHNPPQLQGILIAKDIFSVPHVAVFDTAFHHTISQTAYLYALPYDAYTQHGVRRYGFHGSSFRYVTDHMKTVLATETPNLVIAHLGNGGSLCAIKHGVSVDTTMGLTPLEGIVHGTRCGDIDPAVPEFLAQAMRISLPQVSEILWKKSGLLGLSGISNDCRMLEQLADTNSRAKMALGVYTYRLAKNIAAMTVAVGTPIDALVFTGGIGENSPYIRKMVLDHLTVLGAEIDTQANTRTFGGAEAIITTATSKIVSQVVPTNEELVIAKDSVRIVRA